MGRRSGLSATIAQDYGLSRAEHGSNARVAPLPDGTMAADAPAPSPCENECIAPRHRTLDSVRQAPNKPAGFGTGSCSIVQGGVQLRPI